MFQKVKYTESYGSWQKIGAAIQRTIYMPYNLFVTSWTISELVTRWTISSPQSVKCFFDADIYIPGQSDTA